VGTNIKTTGLPRSARILEQRSSKVASRGRHGYACVSKAQRLGLPYQLALSLKKRKRQRHLFISFEYRAHLSSHVPFDRAAAPSDRRCVNSLKVNYYVNSKKFPTTRPESSGLRYPFRKHLYQPSENAMRIQTDLEATSISRGIRLLKQRS
jgi:hypothetical protein